MNRDLATRSDVHDLVVDFYREIAFDELLGPVFGEVAEVDWALHIPKLIDYWCRVLFGEPNYVGSILGPHSDLNDLEPLRKEFFDRWYRLWTESIAGGWSGPNAERAREHAERISGVLSRRLTGVDWHPPAAPTTDVGGEPPCWAHLRDDLDVSSSY